MKKPAVNSLLIERKLSYLSVTHKQQILKSSRLKLTCPFFDSYGRRLCLKIQVQDNFKLRPRLIWNSFTFYPVRKVSFVN